MDFKTSFYLVLSRYMTYIAVFISSVLIIGDLKESLTFAAFFVVLLLNSSIRINKFEEKPAWYMGSALIEIPLILYMQYGFDSIAFIYLYIIVVDVYLTLRVRHALYVTILAYLAVLASSGPISGSMDFKVFFMNAAINGGVLFFFAGASYMIRMELKRRKEIQALYDELKKSRDELQEANGKLTEYAKKIEDITVLNERNRLAGEIHDTIGHNLTALIMEIDICEKLIDRDVEKTKAELEKASGLARNALSEVRKSVRAIKPTNLENYTGVHAIEELIRDFMKNTRINVKFDVSKQQYKLSPTIEVTLYRTIQEALTNCAKYGQADIVTIALDYRDREVGLTVKDNGAGCSEFTKGVGLRTMEERIHYLGGRINFSGNKGFTINAVIPVEVL